MSGVKPFAGMPSFYGHAVAPSWIKFPRYALNVFAAESARK